MTSLFVIQPQRILSLRSASFFVQFCLRNSTQRIDEKSSKSLIAIWRAETNRKEKAVRSTRSSLSLSSYRARAAQYRADRKVKPLAEAVPEGNRERERSQKSTFSRPCVFFSVLDTCLLSFLLMLNMYWRQFCVDSDVVRRQSGTLFAVDVTHYRTRDRKSCRENEEVTLSAFLFFVLLLLCCRFSMVFQVSSLLSSSSCAYL